LFGVDADGKAIGPLPAVRRWWRTIWRSPMAVRWLEADIEGLYLIAVLRQEFAKKPTTTTAAEIRQQETRYGLDVYARKRLDWRIAAPVPTNSPAENPNSAIIGNAPGDTGPAPPEPDDDPRDVLEFVPRRAG
jgi:hypothetical protein